MHKKEFCTVDPIPEAPHCYSFRCDDDGDDDEDDNVEADDAGGETDTPNENERFLHCGPDTGSTALLFFQMPGGDGREGARCQGEGARCFVRPVSPEALTHRIRHANLVE